MGQIHIISLLTQISSDRPWIEIQSTVHISLLFMKFLHRSSLALISHCHRISIFSQPKPWEWRVPGVADPNRAILY